MCFFVKAILLSHVCVCVCVRVRRVLLVCLVLVGESVLLVEV